MITGSRRGELCALTWGDVDVERAVLWVPNSIAQTKAGLKKKPTKTRKGRRVALDPYTLELLAEHRQRCVDRCSALGCSLSREAYLFSPAPDGSTPFVPRSVTQRYRRMAVKLKLRSTRLPSLRHYSATELIAAGVDIRTVAGRLGHDSGGVTTLKVYAAWVDHAETLGHERVPGLGHRLPQLERHRRDRRRPGRPACRARSEPGHRAWRLPARGGRDCGRVVPQDRDYGRAPPGRLVNRPLRRASPQHCDGRHPAGPVPRVHPRHVAGCDRLRRARRAGRHPDRPQNRSNREPGS
jgi:hypothetical protein